MKRGYTLLFLLLLVVTLGICQWSGVRFQSHIDAFWMTSGQQFLSHVDVDAGIREARRLAQMRIPDSTLYIGVLVDSILALNPTPRYYNDSLAHADSVHIADLYNMRAGVYYVMEDTVKTVISMMEGMPWTASWEIGGQTSFGRYFAQDLGQAMVITQSPNMARLSYQAFIRAKRFALDYGDPRLLHLTDSSYKVIARQVMTMPDSVRVAFGPPPDRPARVPWVLATLAAAFIAASVAGKGWKATASPSES